MGIELLGTTVESLVTHTSENPYFLKTHTFWCIPSRFAGDLVGKPITLLYPITYTFIDMKTHTLIQLF